MQMLVMYDRLLYLLETIIPFSCGRLGRNGTWPHGACPRLLGVEIHSTAPGSIAFPFTSGRPRGGAPPFFEGRTQAILPRSNKAHTSLRHMHEKRYLSFHRSTNVLRCLLLLLKMSEPFRCSSTTQSNASMRTQKQRGLPISINC